MADDVAVTPSASYTVAADDIGGIAHQRVKVGFGADGVYGDVNATNALPVGGTVTVSNGVSVSAQVSGTVTVNGTVTVSPTTFTVNTVGNGLSVTAGVSGTVTVANGVSVSAVVSGTVSISPTTLTVNTVGNGLSVSAQVSGTVTITPTTFTVNTIANGLSVTAAVTGTVGITNASVFVGTTATPAVDASGAVVWVANPGAAVATTVITVQSILTTVVITGTVANSGILFTIGLPTQASTAQIVVAKQAPLAPVLIMVTSTAIAQSVGKYLFTIWTGATGAPAAVGTTSWAVPAGKVLRLSAVQAQITTSAVVGGSVQVIVGVGASASMISASISTQLQIINMHMVVTALPVQGSIIGLAQDVVGESIAVLIAASTAAVLSRVVIHGVLF